MAKISKKRKQVLGKVDQSKVYNLADASKIVKDITTTKFDASVDLSIRLGVDPRKAKPEQTTLDWMSTFRKSSRAGQISMSLLQCRV